MVIMTIRENFFRPKDYWYLIKLIWDYNGSGHVRVVLIGNLIRAYSYSDW